MQILTVNTGSSSIRLSLFESNDNRLLIQKINVRLEGNKIDIVKEIENLAIQKVDVICHRFVCASFESNSPQIMDEELEIQIQDLSKTAPLHIPQSLTTYKKLASAFDNTTKHLAIFDSAWFSTLPAITKRYALPKEITKKFSIERTGFHGIAHRAMWGAWSNEYNKGQSSGRVITIQLGSGCSITAIKDGVAIDTSMGFSPLEGLVMSTRCGDIDPGIILYLQENCNYKPSELSDILNNRSGLLGISGISGDMRELLSSKDIDAQLAIDIFCYRIKKYLGSYIAALGGVDAIIFGGGIGESSPKIRADILGGLEELGIKIDSRLNLANPDPTLEITDEQDKRTRIFVIKVDEESEMAKEALDFMLKENSNVV